MHVRTWRPGLRGDLATSSSNRYTRGASEPAGMWTEGVSWNRAAGASPVRKHGAPASPTTWKRGFQTGSLKTQQGFHQAP